MNYYTLEVAGLRRELPICRVTDDLWIGAFVVFGDAELTVACARDLLWAAPTYDYIITAESKGIPLAHEMARQHNDSKYFLARKKPKLYMTGVMEIKVNSITTEGEQKLYIDTADAEMMHGKKILIVDDVVSTGSSLAAIEALVNAAGGEIVGKMTVLAEGAAAQRNDIFYLEKLPLFNADGSIKE